MTLITGKTFPVKDALRRLGGQWDPTRKGWMVADDKANEAQALVDAGTYTGPGVASSRWPRGNTCTTCGAKIKYGRYCGKCEYAS